MFGLVKVVVSEPGLTETKEVEDGKSLCVSPEVVETAEPEAIRQDASECLHLCCEEEE